ncbi:MAG TPA: M24 family metallopeptidase [Candidatus Nitrosocosmicus sp.]
MHIKRRNKLIQTLNDHVHEKDKTENKSVILFKPENNFYLTNFWGEGITIISQNDLKTKLIVPKLEYTRAKNTSKECDVISSERGINLINTTMDQIRENDMILSDSNDFDILNKIQKKASKKNEIDGNDLLYKLREIKDIEEIEKIKKASSIIDKLFEIAKNEIKENMTEVQLQAILVYEAMKLGARFPPYQYTSNPLIIASGANGSFPHAESSIKQFKKGELIVLDLTLSFDHYISDATRTFGLGEITNEMKNVYEIVKKSQLKGIQQINQTDDLSNVDLICRNNIENEGYGEYFIHSTGHGIGLEVHEPPWVRPNFKSNIKQNMAITIEPGIYIENEFGVRIEDSILITNKIKEGVGFGYNILHSYTKDLTIL